MTEAEVKQRVRQFYDRVGWQVVPDGTYQNARYEDLRPVSQEYIHRCHLRVRRFLKPSGRYLLDAGSGPVQYAEYLTYSEGYQRRVCVDISIIALQEARRRIGEHGLFVVADVANLPFKPEPFEGVVSLHTLHHLPLDEQAKAYTELYRVLRPGSTAVVVNGWTDSLLMRRTIWLVRGMERLGAVVGRLRGKRTPGATRSVAKEEAPTRGPAGSPLGTRQVPTGTFINKLDVAWLQRNIGSRIHYDLYPWRSVNVRFLRAVIHAVTGGRAWLRLLFWLEERFPQFFAEKGQYPMVILHKGS
jgi:ubiquinone/menaquinone biosynthesis C-methylase UbiE